MAFDEHKKILGEEKTKLEAELAQITHKNPKDPSDWEPKAPDMNPMTSDQSEMADVFEEMEKRVQSVKKKTEPIDPEKLYSILACERDGDPVDMLCRMKGVLDPKNTTSTLHTVMKEYLKQNSPVTPTPQKNAIILDAPETLLSQVTGVDYTFR